MKKHLKRFFIGLIIVPFLGGLIKSLYNLIISYKTEIKNILYELEYFKTPNVDTNYILDFIMLFITMYLIGYLIQKYYNGELKELLKINK
tara:strand:+ start:942 stop:1211 length:270 start_codon:yes stop_codon:yes gene_type:complete